jgi:hypothetical protein
MTSGPGPMPRSCIILRTDWVKRGAAKVPGPLLVGSGSDCRSWALWHRDMVGGGGESFGVGFVADHDSVPHHVAGEGLDIVRGHGVAAGQERRHLVSADHAAVPHPQPMKMGAVHA